MAKKKNRKRTEEKNGEERSQPSQQYPPWIKKGKQGDLFLTVLIKPSSKYTKITLDEEGLLVALKEKPVKGKANRALLRTLSDFLQIPQDHITIIKGATSHTKIIHIDKLSIEKFLERFK